MIKLWNKEPLWLSNLVALIVNAVVINVPLHGGQLPLAAVIQAIATAIARSKVSPVSVNPPGHSENSANPTAQN